VLATLHNFVVLATLHNFVVLATLHNFVVLATRRSFATLGVIIIVGPSKSRSSSNKFSIKNLK
jgi:hypothetical protein